MNWHTYRSELAERARDRRLALALNARSVCAAINISHPTLQQWEKVLPKNLSPGKQDLWEKALVVPSGWLTDRGCHTPVISFPKRSVNTVADEIELIGAWLARSAIGKRTINLDQLKPLEKRCVAIFCQRYGVIGKDIAGLQAIGDSYGLTRERIRQIVDQMLGRLSNPQQYPTDNFLKLKSLIKDIGTQSTDQFDAKYRTLLGKKLSVIDADAFARDVLGFNLFEAIKPKNSLTGVSYGTMIDNGSDFEFAKEARLVSLKMIRRCGAAHMDYVLGAVARSNNSTPAERVCDVLAGIDGFEWLSEAKDWFWFGPDTAHNHALKIASRVFAVKGVYRVDIEDLHHALCRHRRHPSQDRSESDAIYVEVPKYTLHSIYLKTPWLKCLQHNDFCLQDIQGLEIPKTKPSNHEDLVIQVIREAGGCANRRHIQTTLGDRITFVSLQFILTTHPTIRNLGSGVFAVLGLPFNGVAFDRALNSKGTSFGRKENDPLNFSNGVIEFTWQPSEYQIRNRITSLPIAVAKHVPPGDYGILGCASGVIQIVIHKKSARANGLNTILRKVGLLDGELKFKFEINVSQKTCHISLA